MLPNIIVGDLKGTPGSTGVCPAGLLLPAARRSKYSTHTTSSEYGLL